MNHLFSRLAEVLRTHRSFVWALTLAWALTGALISLAHAQTPAHPIPFPKESTPMSWKTECIGRVLMDMPIDRARSWSSDIDDAEVRRLQRPLSQGEFWAGVESVREQYAKQAHDLQATRLGYFERLGSRKAAVVIGYKTDASFYAPSMFRFLYIDDQHAYEFKQGLATRNKPPSPELFKPYIDRHTPVLSRITPLRDGEIPSGEGLCFDGAIVSGDTGRNAKAGLNVEIATGTRLGVSYRENMYRAFLSSSFEDLERDIKQSEFGLSLPNEPTAFKEFKVLRRQERTLAGLRGQEFITRTTLNNGHVYYRFLWGVKGMAEDLLTPSINIHLNTPGDTSNAKGQPPYAPLPPEANLIALWDSPLATFRLRPGALPAGQVLRAVN